MKDFIQYDLKRDTSVTYTDIYDNSGNQCHVEDTSCHVQYSFVPASYNALHITSVYLTVKRFGFLEGQGNVRARTQVFATLKASSPDGKGKIDH